jgi:CheY-like chemotaxis protein
MQGHEAIAAGTIAEGMEQLKQQPSHVLLDMNLPDGTGTAVLGHIRASNLPIRVAVVSGSVDAGLLAQAEAMSPDMIFMKPPDWGRVMRWLNDTMPIPIGD